MAKNIAIAARYFNWGGGLDFIHMLGEALVLKAEEQDVKIYLFIPQKPNIIIKTLKKIKSIIKFIYNFSKGKRKLYEKPTYFMTDECVDCFADLSDNIQIVYHDTVEYFFNKKIKEYNIDMILPISLKSKYINKEKYIGYIPDLQHKYYPEFFTKKEIVYRDIRNISLLRVSNKIIVNAKSVKDDIEKFYGEQFNEEKCKIYNLLYTPLLKTTYKIEDFNKIKEKYNLPQKYFVISNQLWKHKDHITAFKALRNLINSEEKFKNINIVCTGSTYDYRFPGLFEEIIRDIKNMNLEENIYFLGYITKNDQLSIMKNSIGVIQPTLFEGGPGGGEVYDSVSMGIPAVVSDINVNKEIDEESVIFFKTGSDEDLALKMKLMIETEQFRFNEDELAAKSNTRLRKLSEELYSIINS